MNIREKLDRLYDLKFEHAGIAEPYRQRILAIEKELEDQVYGIEAEIGTLEKEIENECLDLRQTIEGAHLQVIHYAGRKTLDTEFVKIHHPDIFEACAKIGEPYAVIQVIKRKPTK